MKLKSPWYSEKGLKRSVVTAFAVFMGLMYAPFVCDAVGIQDAQYIAKMSESNPYQALVYTMGVFCVVCIGALGYVYNQNLSQVKDQYTILKSLSDNIATQATANERNQETIQKALDTVNNKMADKPCLLDSDILKDLLKKRE